MGVFATVAPSFVAEPERVVVVPFMSLLLSVVVHMRAGPQPSADCVPGLLVSSSRSGCGPSSVLPAAREVARGVPFRSVWAFLLRNRSSRAMVRSLVLALMVGTGIEVWA